MRRPRKPTPPTTEAIDHCCASCGVLSSGSKSDARWASLSLGCRCPSEALKGQEARSED
jgi:hypothetical protein